MNQNVEKTITRNMKKSQKGNRISNDKQVKCNIMMFTVHSIYAQFARKLQIIPQKEKGNHLFRLQLRN